MALCPLFQKFINDSYKGIRLKPDGSRIKKQTIKNYEYVLAYLQGYETLSGQTIRIRQLKGHNTKEFLHEKLYWKKFYQGFCQYLYSHRKCYDNYVGTVIKIIKAFFNYLNTELGLLAGNFYKSFHVYREDIPIITLLPEQLQFLINNRSFADSLSKPLTKALYIFIFGCTTGLRISDLFTICYTDITRTERGFYLPVCTKKTQTRVILKLPAYAMEIVEKFRAISRGRKTIFPPIPNTRFNNQVKTIAELAGWTTLLPKSRSRKGSSELSPVKIAGRDYRFCDLVSSHTMRRTAISTMLMLGMKEQVVKQISGHSTDSKSFNRYVNFAQAYMDNQMDDVFDSLTKDNKFYPPILFPLHSSKKQ